MERKLDESLKQSKNVTRIILLLALFFYIGFPSLAAYLLFFSEAAIADQNHVIEVLGVQAESLEIPEFNSTLPPYQENFALNTVTILEGATEKTYLTASDTVAEIIAENQIQFDANDIIIPDFNEHITREATVEVIHIDTGSDTETLTIPYRTIYQESPMRPEGQESIIQSGVLGVMVREYDLRYENGELVSKKMVAENVTLQPTPQIIEIGTMKQDVYDGANSCSHWDAVIDSKTKDAKERNWLKYMIRCESHCNTHANAANYYFGLLQFSEKTFYGRPFYGEDIFDGNEQIEYGLSIYRMGPSVRERQFPGCNVN